jgi:hypothetical protein
LPMPSFTAPLASFAEPAILSLSMTMLSLSSRARCVQGAFDYCSAV